MNKQEREKLLTDMDRVARTFFLASARLGHPDLINKALEARQLISEWRAQEEVTGGTWLPGERSVTHRPSR